MNKSIWIKSMGKIKNMKKMNTVFFLQPMEDSPENYGTKFQKKKE